MGHRAGYILYIQYKLAKLITNLVIPLCIAFCSVAQGKANLKVYYLSHFINSYKRVT